MNFVQAGYKTKKAKSRLDPHPMTLYLAWKYQDDPEQALVVNTNLGGDNCHRGVVLGALLEAMHGEQVWPRRWMDGLANPPAAFSQRLAARFQADA